MRLVGGLVWIFISTAAVWSQQFDPNLYSALRWRLIGPFRGGRVTAVAGVPGEPAVYYFGTPGGGVWKSADGGRVWKPIFDQEHVASIGAVAVAPSDPNILYVGTGEQTRGDGVYKSTDAGATWTNVGLGSTRYISSILIDSRNPNVVLVGAWGDRFPGPERGVYKTTDGGKAWNKVLYKDGSNGVMDLCFDPGNRRVLYATLGRTAFFGPSGQPPVKPPAGPDSWIYKSTNQGSTWRLLSSQGLPTEPRGRIGVAVAPGHHGRRVFAILNQGLFRSDDAGATWQRITSDPRIVGNGYFSRVFVDPNDPDTVYIAQTSFYRSTDGGRTFTAYVGAPSGDDFHVLWIAPEDSRRMVLGSDQGAAVSLDGGQTWSSWYNQPTGQFYHVSTDSLFPYRVYAAQQDSGTAAVLSRSDYGEITDRDWFSTAGFEISYIVADPTDPNVLFADGWYGSVLRFDKASGQYAHVFVRSKRYRAFVAPPLAFSPEDPHTLYLGAQSVLKTTDGAKSWQEISPDLTLKAEKPAGKADTKKAGPPTGVIVTLAPSPLEAGEIWAGTSNGLIQLGRDGKAWRDVSPSGLPESSTVSALDASHHDAGTAYAVINSARDFRPQIYRTHDFGQTWQKIVQGLPDSDIARAVREDLARRGMLYAGTETGVYVSFDDGDHWQSLQLNLPTSSVRDLVVHENDLVAATFGRALWILDDLAPLRELATPVVNSDAYLFRPETAVRARWDENQDTPLPPETPAGENPPDGALLDYYLKSVPAGEISLEVHDSQGNLVRRFLSTPQAEESSPANVPEYWFAPPATLTKKAGLNRFVWDLRYPSPKALRYSYYGNLLDYREYTLADHAIPGATPRQQPQGPLVLPGNYFVELTVSGQSLRQPLAVSLDPRVHASQADLVEQLELERKIAAGMAASFDGYNQCRALRSALSERQNALGSDSKVKDTAAQASALRQKLEAVASGTPIAPGLGPVNRDLARLATAVESADVRPPESARAAVEESCRALEDDLRQWRELNAKDVPALNARLAPQKLALLPVASASGGDPGCGGD